MNSIEIIDKKEQLKKQCRNIVESCKTEVREMTEKEKEEFEANKAEIKRLNEQLAELEKQLNQYDEEVEEVEKEDEEDKSNIRRKTMIKKEFSLLKAINAIANNRALDAVASAVANKGAEEMRNAGISFAGQIQIPMESRAISVSSEGEDVVATEMFDVLAPLRAKNVLVQAGAKLLTGLVGDVQIPVMSASNVNWEGEEGEAKDAGTTFTNVKLSPRRVTAYIDVTKQFLAQTDASVEQTLRNDLINALNAKLEKTILGTGAGSATQPAGIFASATGATAVTDFKGLCDIEAEVEDANVMGECKYIMSNKAKATLRNMPKSSKTTQLVMEGGMVDGTPVFNTSNVAEKYFAFGDWSNLAIGQFGGLDITIDPYTLAKDGKVRIVVNAFFDAKQLREGAIVCGKC